MPVNAYITRDPADKPWPPVHPQEATAAIGLVQRLHEALHHEPEVYGVVANLQSPSADLVVLTELGLGVAELKHTSGRLNIQTGEWYAGTRLIQAGRNYRTPRDQVLAYTKQIRRDLIPHLARFWPAASADLSQQLKLQAAVCFTNRQMQIDPQVKDVIERDELDRPGWCTLQLLTPGDFTAWVGGLRFSLQQARSANFAPFRLSPAQIEELVGTLFQGSPWTEIRNLMPAGAPYAYLTLRQPGQEPQLFPLRATELRAGRDSATCTLVLPEAFKRASRQHLRIERVAEAVWVYDQGSTHGTFIDGVRINGPAQLRPGQRITLGGPEAGELVCALVFTEQLPPDLAVGDTDNRS